MTTSDYSMFYQILGFGPEDIKSKYMQPFEQLCADIQRARTEEEAIKTEQKMPTLHSSTLGLLEEFFTIMKNMYDNDQKFRDDFRVALVKTQEKSKAPSNSNKGIRHDLLAHTYLFEWTTSTKEEEGVSHISGI